MFWVRRVGLTRMFQLHQTTHENEHLIEPPCDRLPSVCLQVETWSVPPYPAIRLMSPPRDKAATPPLHSLEWFLVSFTPSVLLLQVLFSVYNTFNKKRGQTSG